MLGDVRGHGIERVAGLLAGDDEVDRGGGDRIQHREVALLVAPDRAEPGAGHGAVERLVQPLGDGVVGLALRLEDLRPDIGRSLAIAERHHRRRRDHESNQMSLEPGRQCDRRRQAAIEIGVLEHLQQHGAVGHGLTSA